MASPDNSNTGSPLTGSAIHPFPTHHQITVDLNPRETDFLQRSRFSGSSSAVMSGRCTFVRSFLHCTCPAGLYDTPTSDDTLCKQCFHQLANHEDGKPSDLHSFLGGRPYKLVENPMTCPREETVSALWKRIQEFHIVHVRATPASGKSTLSRLLQDYVRQWNPEIPVLWCSWPAELPEKVGRGYEKLLRYAFDVPQHVEPDWIHLQVLLIIDEAQSSYSCGSLWNDYIKYITPHHAPMIILFSSWGSATSRSEALSTTPILLHEGQRISIRPSMESAPSVFFTRAEFLDVIERTKVFEAQYGQKFLPGPDVVEYIWNITNGHPAGVTATLSFLAASMEIRRLRKNNSIIPLDSALNILGQDTNFVPDLIRHAAFGRGLPPREFLQHNPKVVNTLRDILLFSSVEGRWAPKNGNLYQADDAVDLCYRQGWIQAELAPKEGTDGLEKTVYVFPSLLHRRCFEWMISRDMPPFPTKEYPSVKALVLKAIEWFSPVGLAATAGRLHSGAERRPLEAVYQDELYRSCFSLLGDIYLASEWSGKEKNGRVDFLVHGMNWAIECVRDGSKLDEHIRRFLPGGRYHTWILSGEIQEYILLDFRKSMPRKPQNPQIPWLYHVIFSADFNTYQVFNSMLQREYGPVTLINH